MAPQYAGSKIRLHGRFLEKDALPVNLGWYTEIEWWSKAFEDNLVEGEIMLIAQKEIGRWTFIINAPDLDHGLVGADSRTWFSFGYSGEARYWVSKTLTLGLQGYGTSGQLTGPDPLPEQVRTHCPISSTILCRSCIRCCPKQCPSVWAPGIWAHAQFGSCNFQGQFLLWWSGQSYMRHPAVALMVD